MTDEELAQLQRGNRTPGMGGTDSIFAPTPVLSYDYGNGTQSGGAPSGKELTTSPDYPNGVPASSGINWSAGLKSLADRAATSSSPAATPQAPALVTGSYVKSPDTSVALNAPTPQLGNLTQSGVAQPLAQAGVNVDPGAPQSVAAQIAGGMGGAPVNQNIADAGISSVPSFQAPPNLVQHSSLLGRIAHGIASGVGDVAHVVKQGISNYGNNLAGLSDAQLAQMTPQQIHQAHVAAFDALSSRVSNPTYNAQGFRQSVLGSIAQGNVEGGQAAQGVYGQQQEIAQKQAAVAQQQRLVAGRAAIAAHFSIADTDAPMVQLQKLTQAASASAVIGDDAGSKAYSAAADAINKRGGMYGTPAEKNVQTVPNMSAPHNAVDLDGRPVAPGTVSTLVIGADGTHAYLPNAKLPPVANPEGEARAAAAQDARDAALVDKQTAAMAPYGNGALAIHRARQALQDAQSPDAATRAAAMSDLPTLLSAAFNPLGTKRAPSPQMAKMVSSFDPSIVGRGEAAVSKLFGGSYVPKQLAGASAMLDGVETETRAAASRQLAQWEREHPAMKGKGGKIDDYFTGPAPTSAPRAAQGPAASSFWKN